jgi:16S rRNA processing protein RimM
MKKMKTRATATLSHSSAPQAGFVTIAKVVKPQGNRGEVSAELLTDFPEKFSERKRLFAARDGSRRELQLEAFWLHKGRVVLKFAGVESISDAETLAGAEIQIAASERAELEAGANEMAVYLSELEGCAVFDGGREIGKVLRVEPTGEVANLVVEAHGGRELLIPFAAAYIVKLDTAAKRLEMQLPEGLLEIDAPLSAEEKREMHGK